MDAELDKIRGQAQKAGEEIKEAEKDMERYNNKKKDEAKNEEITGIPGLI